MHLIQTYFIKITHLITKILRGGSGYTFPGYLFLKVFPNYKFTKKLVDYRGIILVTGTNGKTSTVKMISHILKESGLKVFTNSSGSNLMRGIITALFLDKNILGISKSDYLVLEVDEFELPNILKQIQPNALLILNLSRDQLDRYGETDSILERWQESINDFGQEVDLLLDKTQLNISSLENENTYLFGDPSEDYVSKNKHAAILATSFFDISDENAKRALSTYKPAFGRGEKIKYLDKIFEIHLAKNPVSFTTNLESINFDSKAILIILNDNLPDGRDVSWIYDVPAEVLKNSLQNSKIFISGTRAYDMAVRLKTADLTINLENINTNLKKTIQSIEEKEVVCLPNYSSMLELRKIIVGRKIL